ncbi:hypothetical protein [Flavivirga jejuensis]|uniref:WG repeat protein n=1 Tax=Flavivirga jejuensis TaxID=870487 RepID=A0ABT8WPL0_9FLAO|nr:hypothetical protein [Flavivirga jejuensis]MDO5975068.1 hypothetical protein [Flavivirga jejuensis]
MKKLFSKLLLLIPCLIFSQKIVNIEADLISFNDRDFRLYKKSEEHYRQFEFELLELYDYEHNISYYSKKIETEELDDSVIETKSLTPFSINRFSEQNPSLYFRERNVLYQLNYFNNAYFSVRVFEYKNQYNEIIQGRENKWNLIKTEFYNYFIINIKKNTQILVLTEHEGRHLDIVGFITNGANGLKASLRGQNFKEQIDDKASIKELKELTSTYNYNDKFTNLYRITNHQELRDVIFNKSLLNKKYDTIYIKKGFGIGGKNQEYDVYNLKLKIISPKGTRAVFANNDSYSQILVNNQIKWLTKEGMILKDKPELPYSVCGTVSSVKRKIVRDGNLVQMIEETDNFDGGPPKTLVYNLPFKDKEYETYFLNGSKALSYDDNSGLGAHYQLPGEAYNYFIVKKGDGATLFEYFFKKDSVHSLKKLLPDNMLYTIRSKNYYTPILFQRDEKYGYFPINKSGRYTSIDNFNGSLARFRLDSGKKGWLDIYGNEYIDK